jgi:hypothetical protein
MDRTDPRTRDRTISLPAFVIRTDVVASNRMTMLFSAHAVSLRHVEGNPNKEVPDAHSPLQPPS